MAQNSQKHFSFFDFVIFCGISNLIDLKTIPQKIVAVFDFWNKYYLNYLIEL